MSLMSQPGRVPGVARNPDVGPRCGECRLGTGVHNPADPLCDLHRARPDATATPETAQAARDAAVLRAAAAIVEAREADRPHLSALRNRLLDLARAVAPARPSTTGEVTT